MTVTTNTNRVQYVGDGSVSQFSVPFPFFYDTDLEVYTQASAAASVELKMLNTHYTITGNGESLTGEVDWTVTPPASGVSILIKRVIPQTQESDYVNNDTFNAETLEDDLDRSVMRDQQIQEELDRAVKVGPFGSAQVFPDPLDGYFLFWSSGVLANGKQAGLSGVTVTPFAESLLDDASAGQARGTLGFSPVGSWDVQSGGLMVINSGGELRASTGGRVDLTDGALLVPQASAASGASGQLQLNGPYLEVDTGGAGFDRVGPYYEDLSVAYTVCAAANNVSFADVDLSGVVHDNAVMIEIQYYIWAGTNQSQMYLRSSDTNTDRAYWTLYNAVSGARLKGTTSLPIGKNGWTVSHRSGAVAHYHTIEILGEWRR